MPPTFIALAIRCRPRYLFVILSDARRSVATERESKDLCTLAFPTKHQGILTVPSFIELFAVCKCYGILTVHSVIKLFPLSKCQGTCCRVPYLLVILSDARGSAATERESKDPCTFSRLTIA